MTLTTLGSTKEKLNTRKSGEYLLIYCSWARWDMNAMDKILLNSNLKELEKGRNLYDSVFVKRVLTYWEILGK